MEGKRKRKSAVSRRVREPKKSKEEKEVIDYDGPCHINTMPPEMRQMIFRAVDPYGIFSVVGRFVCKLWSTLLPQQHPTPREPNDLEEIESYKFAQKCAEFGMVSIMKWANDLGCPWQSNKASKAAARQGHEDFLAWMLSQIPPKETQSRKSKDNKKVSRKQVKSGIVKWLNEGTRAAAASGGQLETLKWLRVTAKCPFPQEGVTFMC